MAGRIRPSYVVIVSSPRGATVHGAFLSRTRALDLRHAIRRAVTDATVSVKRLDGPSMRVVLSTHGVSE